jgi:integrase
MRGDGRVYQRGSRFWIAYYGPGPDARMKLHREPAKRMRDGTAARNHQEARQWLKYRRDEVTMHKRGVQAFHGPRAERLLLTDLLADYERHAELHRLKSIRQLRSRLKRLRAHFAGWRALAVTQDTLIRYVQQRQVDGAASATINRETEVIGRAFALARAARKLLSAPIIPSLDENNVRQGFFEAAEFHAVKSALADADLRDLVEYLYRTGWRKGEAATLTWGDVDFTSGIIRLRPEHSKNGRARLVAIGEDLDLKALVARRWEARQNHARRPQRDAFLARVPSER